MSSTFSTVVNFSMLELLHKIKRLDIQLKVKGEYKKQLKFPTSKKHVKNISVESIEDINLPNVANIISEVLKSKSEAMQVLELLEMKIPTIDLDSVDSIKLNETNIFEDSDDETDDVSLEVPLPVNENISELNEDLMLMHNDSAITSVIQNKKRIKLVKRDDSFPSYEVNLTSESHLSSDSAFVEYKYRDKTVLIRKSTALWLLSQPEHVSSDRIYRVRSTPADHNYSYPPALDSVRKSDTLYIGDLCAFKTESFFKLGRIIQFCYLNGKTPKEREYTSNYAFIVRNNNQQKLIGVLCNWFYKQEPLSEEYISFVPGNQIEHAYESIQPYVCTIPELYVTIINTEMRICKVLCENIQQSLLCFT